MNTCYNTQDPNSLIILQGTTPILILSLDCDISEGYEVRVSIKTGINQLIIAENDNLVITPTECGCQVEYLFTQEQTLKLKKSIWVQLRAKGLDTNNVLGTLEHEIKIVQMNDKEVM